MSFFTEILLRMHATPQESYPRYSRFLSPLHHDFPCIQPFSPVSENAAHSGSSVGIFGDLATQIVGCSFLGS